MTTTDSPHRPPITPASRTATRPTRPAATPVVRRRKDAATTVRHRLRGCPAATGTAPCLCTRAAR